MNRDQEKSRNFPRFDKQQAFEWSFRFGVPALAWAAVFAFLAFAGSTSTQRPTQIVEVLPAAQTAMDDSVASPPLALGASKNRQPGAVDPPVAAQGAIPPVGALRSATTR